MKYCKKCNIEHNNNGNFCSRSCANSRIWTEEDKNKKSIAAKQSIAVQLENKSRHKGFFTKKCLICKCEMILRSSRKNQKVCSKQCSNKYLSENAKQHGMGGYRQGSGRSKSGYYKGIFCGSTYELAWVIYRIDKNLPFQRFDGYIKNEELKYFPDFLIENNTIIEIKGYHTPLVDKKVALAKELGYTIKVLYRQDLQEQFKWINEKYGIKDKAKISTLYDSYKPKYNHICDNCRSNFSTDKVAKTTTKFCSRICAGKYRRKQNFSSPCS
jgi:hypothetical protein